ncbi:MAG: hypothetical protein ACTSQI_13255 [Candidatus Helarchaeota archaeon]
MALSRTQIKELGDAGFNQEQIKIASQTLETLLNERIITKESIKPIVNNLVKDKELRQTFFKDPRKAIMEANPQPSP